MIVPPDSLAVTFSPDTRAGLKELAEWAERFQGKANVPEMLGTYIALSLHEGNPRHSDAALSLQVFTGSVSHVLASLYPAVNAPPVAPAPGAQSH